MKPDPRRPILSIFLSVSLCCSLWIHPVSPVFSFTRVAASSEDLTIVSKGGAFSLFPPPSPQSLLHSLLILSPLFVSLSLCPLLRLLGHSFFLIR